MIGGLPYKTRDRLECFVDPDGCADLNWTGENDCF